MNKMTLNPFIPQEEESNKEEPYSPSSSSSATQKSDELRIVDEFPLYEDIKHGDLLALALSLDTTRYTHGIHRFPAKYIPQVPRWAIKQFGKKDSIVLDPFMGSGTSLVEGLCTAKQTYGIDIDPLAQLISRVKTAKYDVDKLKRLSEKLLAVEENSFGKVFLPMEGVKNVNHWFKTNSLRELSTLFCAIGYLKCSDEERDFFYGVFSSILRWVSNADDQSQKTYVSGTLKKNPPPVRDTFKKFLAKALSGVSELDVIRQNRSATVLDGSALSIPLPDRSIDLVVTSPPYLDSVDYMYNFMLEYFWLGPKLGIQTRSDYNARRRSPVGAKNPITNNIELPIELSDLVDPLAIPQYRQKAVPAYFSSMQTHFKEAARVMKDGARYVLVVGNSQAQSGVIPVHDCLLRLARNAGLHLEKAFAYRIRRHYMKFPRKGRGGIILMDWVITLKKTSHQILPIEDRLPLPRITIGHDEVAH